MVAWFKHDIPAWMDGTEGLDDGPYRAYHVICQLIYLNDGPIALNEQGIAGRCKQHILTFRKNLKVLIEQEKLILEDGRLANNRASSELQLISDQRETSAKGGRGSAGVSKRSTRGRVEVDPRSGDGVVEVDPRSSSGNADNSLKDNDAPSSTLLGEQHHKSREEENREEKTTHPSGAMADRAESSEGISGEQFGSSSSSITTTSQQALPLVGDLLPPENPAGRKPARTVRKAGWPVDLTFGPAQQQFAEDRGFDVQTARDLWQRFENHHRAKGSTFVDWLAAWRTWVLNEVKFTGSRSGRPSMANGRYATESGFSPIVDAGLQTLKQINGDDL